MPKKVNQTLQDVNEDSFKEIKIQLNNSHNEIYTSDKETFGNDRHLHKVTRIQQKEEKQRQKLEEKLKKEHEKKQREEEKKRKELEKETERKKRELEKEEEKRKRESEKKQKDFEREEEKRKRELEKKQKDIEREEEKRRKEEEKKRKEDEKKREEEEKKKKLEKQRAILLGFFNKDKVDQDSAGNKTSDMHNIGEFKPIEIKKDMKMSSINRLNDFELVQSYADFAKSENGTNLSTYIDELLSGISGNGSCPETWPLPETEIQIMTSKRLKAKSLLFVENIRPPYYGTWRKKSELIAPLNPLIEDKCFFDYELDSDQEWEYESGEDIGSTDNEEDGDNDEELEDISFLVPHGYLSEGEDIIDADFDDDVLTENKPLSDETKKMMVSIREKQFQAEVKQQVHQINPNIVGPTFISNKTPIAINDNIEQLYRMICQSADGFPITCNLQSDLESCTNSGSSKMKNVPPEAVVHIIRLVHCNQLSRAKLCYEFRMYWEYSLTSRLPDVTFESDLKGRDWDEFSIGKKRFFEKLKEIAERKDGMWVVKPEVIQEYQLCCINDDPGKPCSEKWRYVSEINNMDTKKTQRTSAKPKKRKAQPPTPVLLSNEKLLKCDSDTKPLVEKCQ